MISWFVYILECSDHTLYCGIAKDVEKRVTAHNKGLGAKFTRGRRPVRLLYSEEFETHRDAAKREYELKGWSRAKKLSLIK